MPPLTAGHLVGNFDAIAVRVTDVDTDTLVDLRQPRYFDPVDITPVGIVALHDVIPLRADHKVRRIGAP